MVQSERVRGRLPRRVARRSMVKIVGLGWLETRTDAYEELVRFYRDGMGLPLDHSEPDFAIFRLPDGSRVEVFGPSDSEHRHFSTGPVAGFVVEDIDAARVELERAGATFIGPVHGEPGGDRWAHFRAPDGNVYEITHSPTYRRH